MKTYPMIVVLGLALGVCCPVIQSDWTIQGNATLEQQAQALELIEVAKEVTPDAKHYLANGGLLSFRTVSEMVGRCPVPDGMAASGCSSPGAIDVLLAPPRFGPDLLETSLPHELCHLGTASGGGFCGGPLDYTTNDADACAAKVVARYLELNP